MNHVEFPDEPVSVTGSISDDGQINISQVTWQHHSYTIMAVGRQWEEADGRYVLVEATGGVRFELQLSRESLTWRITKLWRSSLLA